MTASIPPSTDSSASPSWSDTMMAAPGRAVTWRALILTAAVLLVLMTGIAAAVAWWAWHHLAAHVTLREQQADVRLPQSLAVRARVDQQVQVKIDQTLSARVPISQTLSIPLRDPITLQVSVDTVVPIALDVPVSQTLHIDQVVSLDTQVRTKVLGIPLTLPIQGQIPIRADVPINVVIPVRKQLPVVLLTPATVRLTEPLRVQVDTVMDVQVPIKAALSLPVTAPVDAALSFPQQSVRAGLSLLDITLPFSALSLSQQAPKAVPSKP